MPSRHTTPGKPSNKAGDALLSADDKAPAFAEPLRDAEYGYEMAEMAKDGRRVDDLAEEEQTLPGAGALDEEDEDSDRAPLAGNGTRRSSLQSFQLYTPDEDARVRRKLDTRLVLFVALLYMMAFLDRSNIGNAKTAGLTKDLNLSDSQFQWLLTAFYITYVLFEWLTLCYKIFPPHIYIATCVFIWGVIASLQSLVTSFGFLLALRALLGIGEAAFVGMPIYLSFFFRREELAFRTGVFIAAAPLATSFASSLAYLIVRFGSSIPIANWRLLFLLEGFPACLVAIWTFHWFPDSPGVARWLTSRERKVASLRMRSEVASSSKSPSGSLPRHKQPFAWSSVANTLSDPKSYVTALMFFCCNVAFSSMPVFLPTILTSMGSTPLASQLLAAWPNLFAFFTVLITAYLSDRYNTRWKPIVFHSLLACSGYLLLTLAGHFHLSQGVRYAAVFPICAGFFCCVTIVITWTVNNQKSDEGKGTGMAVLNVVGQMGPLVGTRLYPDEEGPEYTKGMAVCAFAMMMVGVLAIVLRWVLKRENRKMRSRGGMRGEFVFMT
ncbi:putative major facilitator superfamily, MFS transporter superfamily [Septoria linicola]|nr:putative major facilitator superfamily, MFS transporter superfamily [Septoria linicola]